MQITVFDIPPDEAKVLLLGVAGALADYERRRDRLEFDAADRRRAYAHAISGVNGAAPRTYEFDEGTYRSHTLAHSLRMTYQKLAVTESILAAIREIGAQLQDIVDSDRPGNLHYSSARELMPLNLVREHMLNERNRLNPLKLKYPVDLNLYPLLKQRLDRHVAVFDRANRIEHRISFREARA
jgi:hypothetical protein